MDDAGTGASVGASDPRVVAFLGRGHTAVSTFGDALAAEGQLRGLVGPREIPRLWERHLLNSAAVAALVPETGTLVDVGSGAGLPGVVRVAWLEHVTALVGLSNTEVLRGRAEDVAGTLEADVVTARAVAPLERLAGWTLPLLRQGGVLLALKGRQAADELAASTAELARFGGDAGEVLSVASVEGVDPTTVVRVVRTTARGPVTGPGSGTSPSWESTGGSDSRRAPAKKRGGDRRRR